MVNQTNLDNSSSTNNQEVKLSTWLQIFPNIILLLILFGLFTSLYFTYFNLTRTFSLGFYWGLLIQIPIALLVFVLMKIEHNIVLNELRKKYGLAPKVKTKVELFSSISDKNAFDELESEMNKFETVQKRYRIIIYLILAMDFAINISFVFAGFFFSIIYLAFAIASQAYVIPIILWLLVMIKKISNKHDLVKATRNVEFKTHHFSKLISKSSIFIKLLLALSIALLLFSSGMLTYSWYNEDFARKQINLESDTDYEGIDIYYMESVVEDVIRLIGTANIPNEFGQPQQKFVYLVYDLEGNHYLANEIIKPMIKFQEGFIDGVYNKYLDKFYFVTHLTNEELNVIYEFNLDTLELKKLYSYPHGDLSPFVNTRIIPTPGGVSILETVSSDIFFYKGIDLDDAFTYILNYDIGSNSTSSIFIEDQISMDMKVFQNNTYLIHLDFLIQDRPNYFALTRFAGSDTDINYNNNETTILNAGRIENTTISLTRTFYEWHHPTTNGATLFEINDYLYYRSLFNLYDITRNLTSSYEFDMNQTRYYNQIQAFPSYKLIGSDIFLPSDTEIQIFNEKNLNFVKLQYAYRTGYKTSFYSNAAIVGEFFYSMSFDSRLFGWFSSLEGILDHEETNLQLRLCSFYIYFMGVTMLMILYNSKKYDLDKINMDKVFKKE